MEDASVRRQCYSRFPPVDFIRAPHYYIEPLSTHLHVHLLLEPLLVDAKTLCGTEQPVHDRPWHLSLLFIVVRWHYYLYVYETSANSLFSHFFQTKIRILLSLQQAYHGHAIEWDSGHHWCQRIFGIKDCFEDCQATAFLSFTSHSPRCMVEECRRLVRRDPITWPSILRDC